MTKKMECRNKIKIGQNEIKKMSLKPKVNEKWWKVKVKNGMEEMK